jgi:hypothetical protein
MAPRNVDELFADDSELTQWVKTRPLTALAIGAAAGFVWGGGAGGKFGRALILYTGQMIIRDTIANVLSDAFMENGRKRRKD